MLSLSTGGALTEYCNGPRSDIATLDKKKKKDNKRKKDMLDGTDLFIAVTLSLFGSVSIINFKISSCNCVACRVSYIIMIM